MTVDLGEIGTAGFDHSGGRLQDEWHRDLQGPDAIRTFREMVDNMGVLGGYHALAELLLRQVGIRVDAGADTPAAKKERDRIEESIKDMKTPTDLVIGEMASSLWAGFDVHEIEYKIRRGPNETDPKLKSKYEDGRIGWRDWSFRAQETLEHWEFDDHGEWLEFVQQAPPDYRLRRMPREKLIHFTPRPWKRSPEGRSMFRSAVRAYRLAISHETQEGIAGERNASGQLWAEVPIEAFGQNADPQAATNKREIEKGLGKFRRAEYSALTFPSALTRTKEPTGYALHQMEGARAMFPYDTTIRRLESRILIAVLSEFILSGIETHGSFSLHDSKTNLLALALGAILKCICSMLTAAAALLSTMNGIPAEEHAIIAHDDIETPDLTHMANFVSQILGIEPGRLNDELRRYLEIYARFPTGALAAPELDEPINLDDDQIVDEKPAPPPPPPADADADEDGSRRR